MSCAISHTSWSKIKLIGSYKNDILLLFIIIYINNTLPHVYMKYDNICWQLNDFIFKSNIQYRFN